MDTGSTDAGQASKRGLPAWAWWLIGFGSLLAAGMFALVAWGLSVGMDLFKHDAIAAMQDNAIIGTHLGTLEEAEIDYLRSGLLPSPNGFVLRVKGSRASGIVEAEFITTLDGERLGPGSLQLEDGREFRLPGKRN